MVDNYEQIINRILNYLEKCRSNQYKKLMFQVGEVAVNDDLEQTIPFIAEIKIDFAKGEEPLRILSERKSTLVTSNSLPQFFNK